MAEPFVVAALLLVPAVAAAFVPLLPDVAAARRVAMGAMLVVLALALWTFATFAPATAPRFAVAVEFLPSLGIALAFAVDGFNLYFLLLTALLFPAVLGCSWHAREGGSRLWLGLLPLLQAGLVGTFLAQDLLVLFVLWEAVLLPMVLVILVFGGEARRRAAMAFFLMTMAGSVLFLAAVLVLGHASLRETGRWSFAFATLAGLRLDAGTQAFVFIAIALACAIKSPLVPFHAWLPLAYREAPATATALMAGVLSKLGAYGFLRLAVPFAPDAAARFAPWLVALAAASIVYGALLALRQERFRMIVAYASLSHMGYIVLGVFTFQPAGVHGALVQVASHGLAVAGLFLLLALAGQRTGGAVDVEGLARRAPRFAVVLMLFVLASLALPATSGFTAEFLVLLGAFREGMARVAAGAGSGMLVAALVACTGVVLGATYMLRFARRSVFGDPSVPAGRFADLARGELLALAPLLVAILLLGVHPAPALSRVDAAVATITGQASPAASVRAGVAGEPGGPRVR